VVDRFGARPVLLFGLTAAGLGIAGIGLADTYWQLVLAASVAACGNAVFHPADFAILTASIQTPRLGRSYSIHSLLGTLGWAAAPAVLLGVLVPLVGWRQGLLVLGLIGPALALLLASQGGRFVDHRSPRTMRAAGGPGLSSPLQRLSANSRVLFQVPILFCFVYFAFLSVTVVGVQYAAIPSLHGVYGMSSAAGGFALTAMLVASAIGVAVGGFIADKVGRHDAVASAGMLLAGAAMAVVASGALSPALVPVVMAMVGFFGGITMPSRDMIVRGATPPGASGKVFGFVYAGLDAGSALSPPLFAFLLDHGMPAMVLYSVAGLYIVTVFAILNIRRMGHRRPATAPAE
jgi:FSR family fosmidomycin resistance protein-like MFS transporter